MAVPTGIVSAQFIHDHRVSSEPKQKCRECGAPLDETAHYCPHCGVKVDESDPFTS
jgi:predicted amidophosphoribosyltransferase